jgi:hypothetical protein
VDLSDETLRVAVGDFDEAVVYFRGSGWIEYVRVEVQGACLEGGLEDVGDVGEKDVVEEEAELEN